VTLLDTVVYHTTEKDFKNWDSAAEVFGWFVLADDVFFEGLNTLQLGYQFTRHIFTPVWLDVSTQGVLVFRLVDA
jgi:hypothetical protein